MKFERLSLEKDATLLKIKSYKDFGLPDPEEIEFENEGVKLSGWFFSQTTSSTPKCGVILSHGYSRTRMGVLKFTPLFWKRGCSLFLYDHRAHGKSGGEFTTYGYYEKLDMLEALKVFKDKTGLQDNRIGIFGISYGAATALQMAPFNDRLAFVGADAPYGDLKRIIRERTEVLYSKKLIFLIPFALYAASIRADFEPESVSPIDSASRIRIPVFLSHSREDAYTSVEHSIEINKNLFTSKKRFHITEWGAPHGKSIDTNFIAYDRQMDEFLRTYTKGFEVSE